MNIIEEKMKKLPKEILEAWKNRKGPIVFSTVNTENKPNSIYATCVQMVEDNKILVADNFFGKTRENIIKNSTGSILFITEEDKSYQLKGDIQYHVRGKYFDDMKKWNPERLPGHAVAIITVQESFCGSKKLS